MLDANFIPPKDQGWRTERLSRYGRWVLIIYHDEQPRGSLEMYSIEEIEKCENLMKQMNDHS